MSFDENCAEIILKKVYKLYCELATVLAFLDASRFSIYFQKRMGVTPKEYTKILERAVLKHIEKVGSEFFPKDIKEILKKERIVIEDDVFLSFVTWRPFPKEDKFLSLASYFSFRLDAIDTALKKLKDDNFENQLFKKKMESTVNFSLNSFPKIFKEYAKFKDKERDKN